MLRVANMARTLFGTDGIRGMANEGAMTPEIAFKIGAGITYQLRQRVKHPPRVIIGKDTRVSGYLLETALAAGVCTWGGRVMLSGPMPTPAIAHLTTSMRADAGIVISASHNPFADNGIKIFGSDGFKLPDDAEAQLERLIEDGALEKGRPTGKDVGRAERLDDARGRYVAFVKQTFPRDLTLEGLKVVVDAANGAAYRVAPAVFAELGAKVIPIGVEPDGYNINEECGAVHAAACAAAVREHHADLGIALDGDADRVIVVDSEGKEVDGDVVMALCATRMLREGTLRKGTLVSTVMSNLGLERAIESAGGRMVRTAVGDRYVVEEMRKNDYNFGGEQSGHMIFLDHASTGDGLVAALQLLAMVLREQHPLADLASKVMTRVPQILVNAKLPARRPLEEMPATLKAIRSAEIELGKSGRVVVRWSGTEPKLRVMIEGEDEKRIEQLANDIADEAKRELASA
ncbi:phosphoglucosamine mutase [Sandaracinus amylolyticus]|uniref:phosphoglucosamine mutase n=1 Tax=Sandaracinus amylolyticus TaxID=927083 RepID=UPI001F0190B5|nr:phosphoglucosamine mutase [Sandaracinus amylolyticus]UJR79799.1 Phosphoglucosamine mutase [Sandaracinus amylolyticus]